MFKLSLDISLCDEQKTLIIVRKFLTIFDFQEKTSIDVYVCSKELLIPFLDL